MGTREKLLEPEKNEMITRIVATPERVASEDMPLKQPFRPVDIAYPDLSEKQRIAKAKEIKSKGFLVMNLYDGGRMELTSAYYKDKEVSPSAMTPDLILKLYPKDQILADSRFDELITSYRWNHSKKRN